MTKGSAKADQRGEQKGGGCFLVGFFLFVSVGLIGAGILLLTIFIGDLVSTLRARADFVPVIAEVTGTDVHTDRSGGRRGSSTSYKPVVNYRYERAGRWYSTDRVMPYRLSFHEKRDAELFLTPYQTGVTTRAWVNPRDPNEAYLRVDLDYYPFGMFLFMTPFVLVVVTLMVLGPWSLIVRRRYRGLSEQDIARHEDLIIDTPERAVLRVDYRFGWLFVPIGVGVASFCSIFAFGLTMGHVSMVPFWVVPGIWSLGLLLGLVAIRVELACKPDRAILFVIDWTTGMYRIGDHSGAVSEVAEVVVHPVKDRNRETRFRLALRTIRGELFDFGHTTRAADAHTQTRDLLRAELGLAGASDPETPEMTNESIMTES